MPWQTELIDALASGEDETAASIVVDEVLAEQRRALAGDAPALTVRGTLRDGELVFDIRGPRGGWQVGRSLTDLAQRARENPGVTISLLNALASSAIGKDRWGEEEWLPYGYIGAGSVPRSNETDYVQTDRDAKILDALAGGGDVVLIGRPASGKTVSALEAARARKVRYGDGIIWLDLTDPFDNAETVMLTLLRSAYRRRFLLVVDDLQANASATLDVLRLVARLRDEAGLSIQALATCWSSAAALLDTLPGQFTRISADGGEVIHRLLADVPQAEAVADEFDRLASGDVVLARTALEHFQARGAVPLAEELADAVAARLKADQLAGEEARRALYWFACLGKFEISVYRRYCDDEFPHWPIAELTRRGLIRQDGEMYNVGHPSTANALVWFAAARWTDLNPPLRSPSRLAFEYLRRAGKPAVQAMLEKLDLVNHGYAPHRDGPVLAKVWPHRGVLTRYLRDQAMVRDCTWGGNAASAIFAAVALALLDQRDAWETTAEYVRRLWTYDLSLELPTHLSTDPPQDAADFVLIEQAMRAEDRLLHPGKHPSGLAAQAVDFDRFYRTWVLGLLLTFENTAVRRDEERSELLTGIAARTQQANGAFYPDRVPWITARVLNGLWHGGLTRDTSPVVKSACDWLRRPIHAGGPFDGHWRSGTGDWNSDVMTTAMCVTALVHAGVGTDDPCVRSGYEYLVRHMPSWRRPGRELDCATATEAIMLVGPDRREIYPVVVELLEWASRGQVAAVSGGEESVKIPYVAEQVVWIVQRVVERELEALLRDFETPVPLHTPSRRHGHARSEPGAGARVTAAGMNGNARPAEGEPTVALSPAASARIAEQAARLGREIDANIAGRETALRGRHGADARELIARQLALWNSRKRRYDPLAALIQAGRLTREVAAEIDALGREILDGYEPSEPGAD